MSCFHISINIRVIFVMDLTAIRILPSKNYYNKASWWILHESCWGHEWPRWNFSLIHNKRNVYEPNGELDKDNTIYFLCSIYRWGKLCQITWHSRYLDNNDVLLNTLFITLDMWFSLIYYSVVRSYDALAYKSSTINSSNIDYPLIFTKQNCSN